MAALAYKINKNPTNKNLEKSLQKSWTSMEKAKVK
jgi:hypothetical protein